MPTRGDFDVGVGDLGVVLEDAARTCECEAGLKVPEGVAVKVGACICMSVKCLKKWALERAYRLASVAAMGTLRSSTSAILR